MSKLRRWGSRSLHFLRLRPEHDRPSDTQDGTDAADPDDLPFPRLRAQGASVNQLRDELFGRYRGRTVIVIGGMSGVPSGTERTDTGEAE